MSVSVAFRAFFKTMFNREASERVANALDGKTALPAPEKKAPEPKAPKQEKPSRSDAVSLMELLQREARLVDFLMEPIDEYSDDQIGAAVRDVHRGCREVVKRVFDVSPISDAEEGAPIEVPEGYSANLYRLVGNVSGKAPFKGELMHHGWKAAKAELPKWTGQPEGQLVISPCEVEIK